RSLTVMPFSLQLWWPLWLFPPEAENVDPCPCQISVTTEIGKDLQSTSCVDQVGQKWVIVFNFSSINPREELQLAELRLLLLDIFYQQETTCQSSFAASPTFPSNWMVLEVTEQLFKWFNKRKHCKLNSADNQVLLVLFPSFSKGGKRVGCSTLLQTAKGSKYLMQGTMHLWSTKTHRHHKKLQELVLQSPERAGSKSLCRRVDFHADFDGIGWGSWIVYPPKYNAFCGEGECPTSPEEEFQPTNNAYVQSLLKYYHPDHVPASCCSSLRMSPLSMLYYEEGQVTIGHHEDMIVEECGCY
uniref:TGF-beta family profile domain-containing protein n=1 Tax=Chelonoidis abingdonii TaxID=106734 RepID=A0A8C0HBN7_CHEAB